MCCGKHRRAAAPAPARPAARSSAAPAQFQYVGETALTAASPLTGRVYHFPGPGARATVDARDLAWISFVPRLSRLA